MTNTPDMAIDNKAAILLEEARAAHENYLIKQQDADLEKAIEYYVDAIKVNPAICESYYRLASLLLLKGQISVEGALEQCRTALTLEPENVNAHIYTGYFQCLNGNFDEAEEKMKVAHEKITAAHKVQTDAIQGETRGESSEYSLLFAHAQDTLMTIYSEINIAKQLIKIFRNYEKRLAELENK